MGGRDGGPYLTVLFDGRFHSRLLGDAQQCFDQANYTALAAWNCLSLSSKRANLMALNAGKHRRINKMYFLIVIKPDDGFWPPVGTFYMCVILD